MSPDMKKKLPTVVDTDTDRLLLISLTAKLVGCVLVCTNQILSVCLILHNNDVI